MDYAHSPQVKDPQTDSIQGTYISSARRRIHNMNGSPTLKKIVELVDARRNTEVDGFLSKVDNQTTQHRRVHLKRIQL
jgi:hypothetical protein